MFKCIWSHTRNINVFMLSNEIRYHIPTYSDTGLIGKIKSIEIVNGGIELTFHALPEKANRLEAPPIGCQSVGDTKPSSKLKDLELS